MDVIEIAIEAELQCILPTATSQDRHDLTISANTSNNRLCRRDHVILKRRVAVIRSLYIPGLYNHNTQGTAANPGTPDLKQHKYADSDELCTFSRKSKISPRKRDAITAKQVLDLYPLFRLVTAKGGLVEGINRKLRQEVTSRPSLPTTITSAAFTLSTQ
ncbi:hypothetical protein QTO34_019514 [Cnephaeus nilssonii]|uniref:AT-rich interactive domain-containing protein 3 n=1 Tax=Cnephaeus nilssonii TaxID=3371016 RepID=A0AA40HXL3_CNENI|nr:hypothetical protein QTO34_019514 [Eptesicus nilssonii]